MVNVNDPMDAVREKLNLSGVKNDTKWKKLDEFLTKQLNGRTWSSYLEDEKTVIWSEIEKYGTENNMGLDEKKLRVINTLLIKISRRPKQKGKPSADNSGAKQSADAEPSTEAKPSNTRVYDPVKDAWIEKIH